MLKIDHCRPDMGPPKHVNCLFSLNFKSERLQYLTVRIKNWPPESERVVKSHPFPLVALLYPAEIMLIDNITFRSTLTAGLL